jgi:hypothetical protein
MARTPIHRGEHLAEELKELSISAELARQIDVPVNRVTASGSAIGSARARNFGQSAKAV